MIRYFFAILSAQSKEFLSYRSLYRSKIDGHEKGDFQLISYESGITYGAMLLASEVVGDSRYAAYTLDRLEFICKVLPYFRKLKSAQPGYWSPVYSVMHPHALDNAGCMCAAMIKAPHGRTLPLDMKPAIANYIDYILTKEFRLKDGTLARNRPQPKTLCLDDLYMSLPTLAQRGYLCRHRHGLRSGISKRIPM
ncbi:glycoside hydrolase family 88 protein [Sphingobacterium puteale]|uniref:glycoside hydrolase family 88 protein n=1 Tax=Sphingobacterium puteale TaxID=2420510 RepID=UPI003D96AE00